LTPLFKKYERVQRSHEGLSGKGNRGRRWLFKAAFEDLQIRENVRFLDEIWLTVNEGFIQRIIDPPIVAGFKRDLFPYGFPASLTYSSRPTVSSAPNPGSPGIILAFRLVSCWSIPYLINEPL
jgi:hypothetical protein